MTRDSATFICIPAVETHILVMDMSIGTPETFLRGVGMMISLIKQVVLPVVLAVSVSHANFYKAPQPDKYEGDKPYTPTRLEWLTAYNRNECGVSLNGIPTVSWGLFNVNGTKDTITIMVYFSDEAVRSQAQQAALTCERNIRATTKDRGWTWIKTVLQVGNRDVSKNPRN